VLRYALEQTALIGMTPAAALRLATSTAAAACGLATSKGRLAPGFDADVIAVDGNRRRLHRRCDRVRLVAAPLTVRAAVWRGFPLSIVGLDASTGVS
jgi:imidazolonepropionase-like amidohydrolase